MDALPQSGVRALVLGFVLLFAALTLWQAAHPSRYLAPDSFTYFAMAKHAAESGAWYSYSGVDHATGVHPAYYFLLVPFAALAGDALPLWSFFVNGAFILAGLFLLLRALGPIPTFFLGLILMTSQAAGALNNGMESALLFFALSGFASTLYRAGESLTIRTAAVAGAYLALAVFARLDTVLLVAPAGLIALVGAFIRLRRGSPLFPEAVTLFSLGAPVALALIVSFSLSYIYDGTLLPLSGELKSSFPEMHPESLEVTFPVLKIFVASLGALGIYLLCRFLSKRPIGLVIPALAGGVALFFAYNVLYASGIGAWYGTLPLFALALVLGLSAHDLLAKAPTPLRYKGAAALAFILLVLIIVGHAGRQVPDWVGEHREAARVLTEAMEKGEAAAEYKDGIIAFYVDAPVYNLTGLGNNREYADAVRDGTLQAYLEGKGVAYVVAGESNSGLQVPGGRVRLTCADPFYESATRLAALYRIESCRVERIAP